MSIYKVWCVDLGSTEEDAREVQAHGSDHAARVWASDEDRRSADYWIVGGQTADVYVRCPDGSLLRYLVTGKAVPEYHSQSVKVKQP